MKKSSELLNQEEIQQIREKYAIRNPKKYVSRELHRRIMLDAIATAKLVIDHGGTNEEVKAVCLFLYICVDARKFRLEWSKARKDLKIEELRHKYTEQIHAPDIPKE